MMNKILLIGFLMFLTFSMFCMEPIKIPPAKSHPIKIISPDLHQVTGILPEIKESNHV